MRSEKGKSGESGWSSIVKRKKQKKKTDKQQRKADPEYTRKINNVKQRERAAKGNYMGRRRRHRRNPDAPVLLVCVRPANRQVLTACRKALRSIP